MTSTSGCSLPPKPMPQSTARTIPAVAAAAVEVEIHADFARPAQRQEGQVAIVISPYLRVRSVSRFRSVASFHVVNVGAGLRSANSRSPSSVRSGSICSIIIVPSANSGASPPVATTFIGPPNSALIRASRPSISPT